MTDARHDERGQIVVLVALLMSALLLAVGLAIDAGQLLVARRTAQEAADAAAWAGAVVLHLGGTTSNAAAAAVTDAQRNGFTTSGTTTVTVNAPPVSGPRAGDARFVEVVISRSVRTAFFPQGSFTTVSVRSVAGAAPVSTGYALMALEPTKNHAFEITGNGNVTVTGGSVYVNSNAPDAAKRSGNGTLTLAAPALAYVVGGQTGFTNPWVTGVPPVPDPFAGYPKPSTSGLPNWGKVHVNSGTVTLQPGIDCKKISVTHDGAFNVTAPMSGPYKGMLIYQDADCKGFHVDVKANGGITAPSGTIYVPTADLKVTGNGDLTMTGQLIAESVKVTGNGNLTVNFDAGATAQAILPALVE